MSGGTLGRHLWSSNQSNSFYGCCNASSDFMSKIFLSGFMNGVNNAECDGKIGLYLLFRISDTVQTKQNGFLIAKFCCIGESDKLSFSMLLR